MTIEKKAQVVPQIPPVTASPEVIAKDNIRKTAIIDSSKHLQKRTQLPPVVSSPMVKQVSEYRKSEIMGEVESGKLYAHGYVPEDRIGSVKTVAGNVLSVGLNKKANLGEGSHGVLGGSHGGGGFRGPGGTVHQTPEIYSPLWLNSNMNLPRDRATINAWCRSYFALNPIVKNAISLHSTYPISKMNIRCKNEKVNAFFENMIDEIDLMNICVQVAQEYWILGEAIVYAELDQHKASWSRLIIQNPDYIDIKNSVIPGEPIISLRPDENLRRICTGNRPSDLQQRQMLDRKIVEHVRKGENIPFDNFYVSYLANKISPYEKRGTGLPVSAFRYLMLLDKVYENKYVQADSLINPMTIVKVGSPGADGCKPQVADLEAYREIFEQAESDKNFKIITHDAFDVDFKSKGAGIYDTTNMTTEIIKLIYIGLMVPQVIMDGGSDVTYVNGGISLDVLRQRYMQFRNMISSLLRRKIFAPISKINDFYDYKDKQKVLIVPDIEWNHMSLFDMGDYTNSLVQLVSAGEGQSPKVSLQTLYRSLGLEYKDEQRKIRREMIDNVIHEKEIDSLKTMGLDELRGLKDEEAIPEKKQSPLPGEQKEDMPPIEGELPGVGEMPPMGSVPEGGLELPSAEILQAAPPTTPAPPPTA